MGEKIYIYHTNDLHSYFDHLPHVATILKEKRAERAEAGDSYYVVDIGDHMDRVHPVTEATLGKANVTLLNEMGYDLVTLGNNEGITLSHHQLFHLYDDADFSIVCTNLTSTVGKEPAWLKRHKIVETPSGVRLAFIGLTAAFNPYYNQLDWHVEDPFATIRESLRLLTNEADVLVLLSHLGIYDDQRIAEFFPEIDIIIGGHTHHLLRTGEKVGETLLAACGKQCSHIGEIMFEWDHENGEIVSRQADAFPVEDYPADVETKNSIAQLSADAHYILNKELVVLREKLSVSWFRETKLMKEFTEELQQWTGADCALLNAGILLDELRAGPVSYGDIHRICPHPINPCVVHLTGAALMEVIERSATKDVMELKLKGFGFRGEIIGKMIYANLDIEWRSTNEAQATSQIKSVLIGGRSLERERLYKVATGDLFTFGSLLPPIANAEICTLYMPEMLRDILMQTILRLGRSVPHQMCDIFRSTCIH